MVALRNLLLVPAIALAAQPAAGAQMPISSIFKSVSNAFLGAEPEQAVEDKQASLLAEQQQEKQVQQKAADADDEDEDDYDEPKKAEKKGEKKEEKKDEKKEEKKGEKKEKKEKKEDKKEDKKGESKIEKKEEKEEKPEKEKKAKKGKKAENEEPAKEEKKEVKVEEVAPVKEEEKKAAAPTYTKIAPFGREDTGKELQDHAAKTQDTLVDAVENAEVAEIKRAVFRSLTRLRAASIKEFDTIARLETQSIDAYNDAHHYRSENPLSHIHEDEAPVETDKLKSFH
eukprot:TRINITY_DN278_c0_g1_i3.p1 TRINITY_DN278_c0_g1~~TRINITY_DN278_c0_g1_i3.p1  ORF type:complete len:285 (+),score=142.14 TRINITY_DN278_c0_g1_i3:84-938(+)